MRFANEKIAKMVDYLQSPIANKASGEYAPTWYGKSEQEWRQEEDAIHRAIQSGKADNAYGRDIVSKLAKKYKTSEKEAKVILNHSRNKNNRLSRHVSLGVPHAHSSEELARQALIASGHPSVLAHGKNPFATDIETMIGNVRQMVDVQNRTIQPGARDILNLGVLTGLNNQSGLRAWANASPETELQDIIEQAKGRKYTPDKLYQERGVVDDDMVKDYLISGKYDASKVQNLAKRVDQGYYDPTTPEGGLSVIDLNVLRDNLYGMRKKDIKGVGIRVKDYDEKLKLGIPMSILNELSKPSEQLITREVQDVLQAFQ